MKAIIQKQWLDLLNNGAFLIENVYRASFATVPADGREAGKDGHTPKPVSELILVFKSPENKPEIDETQLKFPNGKIILLDLRADNRYRAKHPENVQKYELFTASAGMF